MAIAVAAPLRLVLSFLRVAGGGMAKSPPRGGEPEVGSEAFSSRRDIRLLGDEDRGRVPPTTGLELPPVVFGLTPVVRAIRARTAESHLISSSSLGAQRSRARLVVTILKVCASWEASPKGAGATVALCPIAAEEDPAVVEPPGAEAEAPMGTLPGSPSPDFSCFGTLYSTASSMAVTGTYLSFLPGLSICDLAYTRRSEVRTNHRFRQFLRLEPHFIR